MVQPATGIPGVRQPDSRWLQQENTKPPSPRSIFLSNGTFVSSKLPLYNDRTEESQADNHRLKRSTSFCASPHAGRTSWRLFNSSVTMICFVARLTKTMNVPDIQDGFMILNQGGEPIEQFRVRRHLTLLPKILCMLSAHQIGAAQLKC